MAQASCSSLVEFLDLCDQFRVEQRFNRITTHQLRQHDKLISKVIVKSKHDWHIVQDFGNNLESDVDDSILVRGPDCLLLLSFANSLENGNIKRKFNLLGIQSTVQKLDLESPLGLLDWYGNSLPVKPVTFGGYYIREFLDLFHKTSFEKTSDTEVSISFSEAKDINTIQRSGQLTFFLSDRGPILKRHFVRSELRDESGNVTTSREGDGEYTFVPGRIFELDFDTSKSTRERGERAQFEAIEISDEEFTPEFYGINPRIGLARTGVNWWLWGTVIGCALMILVGLWLKRRSS